jgi:hypothetical protein
LLPGAGGSLELHRLVFFSRRTHDRVLAVPRPEASSPGARVENWSWQCFRCGGYTAFVGTAPVYVYCQHCGTGRIVSEEEYIDNRAN